MLNEIGSSHWLNVTVQSLCLVGIIPRSDGALWKNIKNCIKNKRGKRHDPTLAGLAGVLVQIIASRYLKRLFYLDKKNHG